MKIEEKPCGKDYWYWLCLDIDLALLADSIQGETEFLHGLEKVASEIGFYVNASKTEFMSFNQDGTTNSLNGDPIKSTELVVFLGSQIANTLKRCRIKNRKILVGFRLP